MALVTASGCGGPQAESRHRPPIVLISIDTLRADRLPLYGYRPGVTPALDSFGADATLFRRAYAHVPLTLPSHVSAFTGMLPPEHGVRDNSGYRLEAGTPYAPRRLRQLGYRTGAFVSSFVLRSETGMGRGFDWYDDAVGSGLAGENAQRPGGVAVDAALDWLDTLDREAPFFLFVHLYEPHTPWEPPEPWASRLDDPYDGEVAAADELVGRLLTGLRERGLYDRSAVIVMSDHGEGLGDHGEEEHGLLLYREALHVPLLIKWPSTEGWAPPDETERPVGLVELAPTLLAVAEGRPDASPLAAAGAAKRPDAIYSETYFPRLQLGWSELESAIAGKWHLIDGPSPELYDLEADPGESRNLVARQWDVARELRKVVVERGGAFIPPGPVDEETGQKLRALGYLAGGADPVDGELPDPRSMLPLFERIRAGVRAVAEGRGDEAVAILEEASAQAPGSLAVWEHLAQAYQSVGRIEDARSAADTAVGIAPGNERVVLKAAHLAFAAGDAAGATALAESMLDQAPVRSREALAGFALVEGRASDARRHAMAALERDSTTVLALLVLAQLDLAAGDAETAATRIAEIEAEQARRASRSSVEGLYLIKGKIEERRGNVSEARQSYLRELELHPPAIRAHLSLAGLESRAGRRDAAVEILLELAESGESRQAFNAAIDGLEALGFSIEADELKRRTRPTEAGGPGSAAERHEAP